MNKRRKKDLPLWQRLNQRFSAKEGNLKIVLLCVLAATTFWFFSALNKTDYTTRLDYPIVFSYPTDSTYLLSQLPENISVQVSGGGWHLLRKTLLVNTRPVQITLDEPTRVKAIRRSGAYRRGGSRAGRRPSQLHRHRHLAHQH